MPAERKDQWVRWIEQTRLPRARRRRIAETVRRFSAPAAPAAAVERERVAALPLPRDDRGAWLLGLALLAGLAAFLVWYTVYRDDDPKGRSTVVVTAKATVPKVVGIRYQSAVLQLKEAKLTSKLVRRAATKPRGIVIGQKPQAGATVPQGTPVTLVVSNGPPGVKMPDVVGLAAADAAKALQARNLRVTLKQVASQEAPGTVVGQEPTAGKRAKPGAQVVLQVAKGAAPVSVPDVTGQLEQQATAALKQAGLTARVVLVPSSQAKGTVVAQRPGAGQKVAKGSAVRLNVSSGATTTTTQQTTTQQQTTTTTTTGTTGNDYTGLRLQTAVQRLAQGGQQAIVVYVASSKPVGVVVSNSTAGSRERLRVSAGPNPKPATSVPDVTAEDAATAQQDLQAAGFTVIQVQWAVSDQSQNGMVVYETATGQGPEGSAIVIYVGSVSGG
ncbi:MAG: eukaryotic-like serine/threonine-protein kinase, partial [Gaiellaceae bacterium]|nr:eukaryotic-like serine/threonine-protein kinase [Gaiellaceae bacterium]